MDTRFWGPSGWKFLHLLLELSPEKLTSKESKIFEEFLLCWRNLLPCKYCRISYTKYITSYPIQEHSSSRNELTKWLWVIHNKVNNKLRKQGYCNYSNPELSLVRELYKNLATNTTNPIKILMELGHDFLGSIIINYSAYVHNNPNDIDKINSYYYQMAYLLPKIMEIVVNDDDRFKIESSNLIKKMHEYYKKKPLILKKDGSNNDDLIQWYYGIICMINSNYCISKINKFIEHFQPYIVDSCNKKHTSQKINSCRKSKKIDIKHKSSRKYTRNSKI
jgi:hypothetical protein